MIYTDPENPDSDGNEKMSRMRLMLADEAGASTMECLYCGARSESTPPYAVMYCHCRSVREDAGINPRVVPPLLARAA